MTRFIIASYDLFNEYFILAKFVIAQDSTGRTSQQTQLFSLDGSRPTLDIIPAVLLLTDFFTLVSTIAPTTSFKLFEANAHSLHSSLQGRVLFSVFFGIIVLGLGFLRRCDPSACKGMSAREYSYIRNKIFDFDRFSALLFVT